MCVCFIMVFSLAIEEKGSGNISCGGGVGGVGGGWCIKAVSHHFQVIH